jgi:type III secretion protein U
MALLAWLLTIRFGGRDFWERLSSLLDIALTSLPAAGSEQALMRAAAGLAISSALTFALPVAVVVAVSSVAQTGPVLSGARLAFDLSRLAPTNGLARLARPEGLIDLARGLLAALALGGALILVLKSSAPGALALVHANPEGLGAFMASALGSLLVWAVIATLAIGVADLVYQRVSYEHRLRMTQQEFKDDRRVTEGDPRTKARRKDLYRQWQGYDAVEATRGAVAVVTNPTHLAVAIRYDATTDPAPIIAAKGHGEVAARMRAVAEQSGVPIVQNIPLARALHSGTEINDVVPEKLFGAVAEVLIWARRAREEVESKP